MTHIGLAIGDWTRDVAKQAQVPLLNRFFEQDPVPLDGEAALLARPGLRYWVTAGSGPIRGMFQQKGMFGDSLMVVSGNSLYKVQPDESVILLGTGIAGDVNAVVPMCCTDEYLFIADGTNLWIYTDTDAARGTLTVTSTISNGEQVVIGSTYYQFVSGSVDAGTPAGTSSHPWLVAIGSSISDALANLANAIDGSGVGGTDYSTALTGHTSVEVENLTSSTLQITAQVVGTAGNSIATTETLANGSWGGATLSGGGASSLATVAMPDDVGAVWVDTIASFVIVVVAQGFGENGRFYWLEPGSNSIDPLDFATAERAPDALYSVLTVGDQFYLFGSSTTEIWYPTGDSTAPFQRIQGRLFDNGIWSGTAVLIGDTLMVTDRDGKVWMIGNDGMGPVSNHGIEERIREAMAQEIAG